MVASFLKRARIEFHFAPASRVVSGCDRRRWPHHIAQDSVEPDARIR
jgi:hypothetical protein